MIKKRHYIILLTVFVPSMLFAQNSKVVSDFRTRAAIEIEKNITSDFKIFSEIELGFEQNISKLGKIHGEAGFGYSIIDDLTIEVKYRFTKNRKNYSQNYKLTHTYAFSAEYTKRFDLLKSYVRVQFKNIDDEALANTSFEELRNIIKPRLKFKYDIWASRFSPFFYSELYLSTHKYSFQLKKIKTVLGAEYEFPNDNELKLYYRNDRELIAYLPYMYHTLGISYCIKF